MRLRNVRNANEILNSSNCFVSNPSSYKGKYQELFNNDNPIHLEIGMGKGDFIIGMAKKYPNINFIGIEKYESVQCRAVEKLEGEDLPNLKLICYDAMGLDDIFDYEIDTIYLNFSDPWPKNRHAKRRLTSSVFLPIYDKIFASDCKIIQKTDNILLFSSSIVSLSQYGYIFEEVNMDLHNSDIPNVETEYERKFSSLGFKINYLKAIKKN